jgi:hypothetical protein
VQHDCPVDALDRAGPFQRGDRPVYSLVREAELGGDLDPWPVDRDTRRVALRLQAKPGQNPIGSLPDIA